MSRDQDLSVGFRRTSHELRRFQLFLERENRPRRPDVPSAGCGKLLFSGTGSLPVGQRLCRACRGGAHPGSRRPARTPDGLARHHLRPRRDTDFHHLPQLRQKRSTPRPAPHMCSVKPPTPSELEELGAKSWSASCSPSGPHGSPATGSPAPGRQSVAHIHQPPTRRRTMTIKNLFGTTGQPRPPPAAREPARPPRKRESPLGTLSGPTAVTAGGGGTVTTCPRMNAAIRSPATTSVPLSVLERKPPRAPGAAQLRPIAPLPGLWGVDAERGVTQVRTGHRGVAPRPRRRRMATPGRGGLFAAELAEVTKKPAAS